MATFPGSTIQKCNDKFAIRTKICQETGEEIAVTGSFAFTGIDKLFKTTTFNITDTEVQLPPSPDPLTKSFTLVNHSETDSIYIGETGVTAGVVAGVNTSGYEIPAGESFNVDFQTGSTVELYAIAESGKTVLVQMLELG